MYIRIYVYYLSLYITLHRAVAKNIIVVTVVGAIYRYIKIKYSSIAGWISGLKAVLSHYFIVMSLWFQIAWLHDYLQPSCPSVCPCNLRVVSTGHWPEVHLAGGHGEAVGVGHHNGHEDHQQEGQEGHHGRDGGGGLEGGDEKTRGTRSPQLHHQFWGTNFVFVLVFVVSLVKIQM